MAGLFGLQAADVIRKAAVAGQFYTANPSALKKELETYLQDQPAQAPRCCISACGMSFGTRCRKRIRRHR